MSEKESDEIKDRWAKEVERKQNFPFRVLQQHYHTAKSAPDLPRRLAISFMQTFRCQQIRCRVKWAGKKGGEKIWISFFF